MKTVAYPIPRNRVALIALAMVRIYPFSALERFPAIAINVSG